MNIKTKEPLPQRFVQQMVWPKKISHKGQNGRILVVGGSSLFHAACLWAAETVSHFADMVHFSSTVENSEVFLSLKKKFRNGMVVSKKDLPYYAKEDDVILIGSGMMRGKAKKLSNDKLNYEDLLKITEESEYTYELVKYLIDNFPEKKFVFDAGALQMMEVKWLKKLTTPPILTPHQQEFDTLFHLPVKNLSETAKGNAVIEKAKINNCLILLKAVTDFISNGDELITINGGNAGLTKGGTGDVLAALCAAFYVKNTALNSAVLASYLLKKTADALFMTRGYWYNTSSLIEAIPEELVRLTRLII